MVRYTGLLLAAFLAAGSAYAVLPDPDGPVRTLYLIRHGEYEHDEACDEDVGCGLVALGRQQARLVAARLDAIPVTFTALQTSTMTRARQTAAIVSERFPGLAPERHRDIRECTPSTIRIDIMDGLEAGEAAACAEQLELAWGRLFRPAAADADEHDIVVCHGNVIRWFTTRVMGANAEQWLQMSIANCSLTIIQVRADGSLKLIAFADSGHLPWQMTTYPGVTAEQ